MIPPSGANRGDAAGCEEGTHAAEICRGHARRQRVLPLGSSRFPDAAEASARRESAGSFLALRRHHTSEHAHGSRGGSPMTPVSHEDTSPFLNGLVSLTARFDPRRLLRGLIIVTVLSVIAVFSTTAGNAGADITDVAKATSELNRVAIPDFDPDTWKPTQEMPLPPMESPITFKAKDDASYWFDHENEDVEKVTHSRSLAAGVGPTTIKVIIGEPATEAAHTVSFIVWPEGAKNMPFTQPGGVTGEQSVDLITPGLY